MNELNKFNDQQVLAIKKLQAVLKACEHTNVLISDVSEYLITIHESADIPPKDRLLIN